MKKYVLIIISILIILLISKPKDSTLESKAESRVYEQIMPDTNFLLVSNMAHGLASKVEVKNYYLFNVAYIGNKSIGFGILFMTFIK